MVPTKSPENASASPKSRRVAFLAFLAFLALLSALALTLAGSSAGLSPPGQLVTSSGPTVGTISLPGTQPTGIAFYAGGNKLFVADNASGNLLMVDGVTRQVVHSVFVGSAVYSSSMVVDEAHGKIYVGSDGSIGSGGTGLISVVNASTGELIKTINPAPEHSFGYAPGWFRLAGDNVHGKVYVSFFCADCTNTLGVIDVSTDVFTPVLTATDVSPTFVAGYGVQGVNTVTNEAFAVSANNLYAINGGDLSWSSSPLPHSQPLSFAVNEVQNKLYFWFNGPPYPSGVVVLDRTTDNDKVLEGYGDKEPLVFDQSNDTLFSGAQVDTEGIVVNGATDAVSHVDFGAGGMDAGEVRSSTDNAYFASPEKTFVVNGATKQGQPLVTVHGSQGGVFASSVAIDQQRGFVYVVNDDHDGVISVIQDGPPKTLTVSAAGTGSGRVTSSPAGIDCGSDYFGNGTTCSRSFAHLSEITLTANPDFVSGSTFTGWSGACSGTGTCTVTMDADRSVTALFASRTTTTTTTSSTTITTPKPLSHTCVVPRVKGKTFAVAKRMINNANCSLGKVARRFHAKIKKGRVISQAPAAGKRLAKGGKVNLVLSRGKSGH